MYVFSGKYKIQQPDNHFNKMYEILDSLISTKWDIEFNKNNKLKLI